VAALSDDGFAGDGVPDDGVADDGVAAPVSRAGWPTAGIARPNATARRMTRTT
jgi:hypothetical protein